MDSTRLQALLEEVAAGARSPSEALDEINYLPFESLGAEVKVDHHRELRSGVPEAVLGEWKTAPQIASIMRSLAERGNGAMATRVSPEKAAAVLPELPGARYYADARMVIVPRPQAAQTAGLVALFAAGTSDVPVAEEAALTLEYLGHTVERVYDVGVAGLHRLLAYVERLRRAQVIVVVAGMEGALASVVSGLVAIPIIAVPTSVGYGASLGGIAALLSMLSSCAPGVTVVNIDNGFGAAVSAARICRQLARKEP